MGKRLTLRSIIWLITGKCDFNCLHCYASWFRDFPELETEECIRIIHEASELGVNHIGFSGGEVFLRRDILRLLEECQEYNIETTIVTNGSLINEQMAKNLYKREVYIYLSIDGDPKAHEMIRGRGTWKFVKRAVNNLEKAGVDFAVITALCKYNISSLRKVVDFLKKTKAKTHALVPVMPFGRATWDMVLSKNDIITILEIVNELSNDFHFSLWCMPFAYRFINSKNVYIGSCRMANVMDIGVNGDVLLCDVLNIPLTNVRNKPLIQALKEQESHELMKKVTNPNLRDPCKTCPVKNRCLGGCYARSFSKFHTFDGPDPLCPALLQPS